MTRLLPAPPPRVARLPRNKAGYPVPHFVAWIDGEPDFRVVGHGKMRGAITFRCCWICGGSLLNRTLGPAATQYAYVIGPMCAVNQVSAEPPMHRSCAVYAATACPFLTTPGMRRRDTNLPQDAAEPDGVMVKRNPGVALVWVTNTWHMISGHQLFDVGEPTEVRWYAEGRDATRDEVLASIDSGMPLLRAAAEQELFPEEALAMLDEQYTRALQLLPGGAA
ncbi:hypothetical protein ACFWCA_32625 [Streptomyces phaeochromogenes]|uniref:hypothetical protein n=1 Tax=Streptomyces phaeochromogenes TaxID=1923 RepID=UPI003678F5D5